MRITCRITEATNTHSEYVMLINFLRGQYLGERASLLPLYVHCLSCYNLDAVRLLRGTKLIFKCNLR